MFGVVCASTKTEKQSVAQIVISTAPQDNPMVAFNFAHEPHAQQQFLPSPPPKNKFKTLTPLAPVGQKPPTAPAQNHESALTDKPLDPQHTHTPAAQLRSLVDLRTYVVVAAQGTHSGGSASAFWLVTEALGRLSTHGTCTLLVAERRQQRKRGTRYPARR